MCRHVNPKEDELTIHDDQTGERKPVRQSTRTSQPSVPDGAELVAFPGINAPIPEGADPYTWVGDRASVYLQNCLAFQATFVDNDVLTSCYSICT